LFDLKQERVVLVCVEMRTGGSCLI